MRRIPFLVAIVTAATLLITPATRALADNDQVTAQVNYALARVPGGTQTSPNQVIWPDGTILTVDTGNSVARAAAASCASGKFCAYADLNGAGSHLDFATCPSANSVAALPQVRSIANARSSGTVTGRNGSTVIVTVNPGTTKNVTKTIDRVVCAL